MLQCTNLCKKYTNTMAVSNLTLEIEKGRVYAFIGPNGSGKTTFMKMVAGLVKPTSGSIEFNNQPVGVYSKSHIAYMPTEVYFFPYMTCKDVGKYYRDFFKDFEYDYYMRLLDEMELNPKEKAKHLSSGMAAKLKIAATLSRKSDLIMLDEPLNGVDIITRDQVIDVIRDNISPDRSFLVSSHLVDELERIVNFAVFMKKGDVVRQGDVKGLEEQYGMSLSDMYRDIYGGVRNA